MDVCLHMDVYLGSPVLESRVLALWAKHIPDGKESFKLTEFIELALLLVPGSPLACAVQSGSIGQMVEQLDQLGAPCFTAEQILRAADLTCLQEEVNTRIALAKFLYRVLRQAKPDAPID